MKKKKYRIEEFRGEFAIQVWDWTYKFNFFFVARKAWDWHRCNTYGFAYDPRGMLTMPMKTFTDLDKAKRCVKHFEKPPVYHYCE